jgi:adenine-specific DNA-methyltransferase
MNNKTTSTAATSFPDDFGHSPDALAQRQTELLALLRQAAPEVISDNQIDVDKLKALLGQDSIAPDEHYELNWAGKAAARREIQKTSSHTLLPSAANPPSAQHMLIEGENLEVLRVLQKSYYGKVKMIYIDPPYNTGNDSFVYPDDYSETLDQYQKRTGEKNEAGFLNKQSLWKKNSKESGQYHSAWLSMMYPRLYLARNLLRDDGVIFISIDDNEAANLKLLCDEVFGTENFVAQIVWQKKYGAANDAKYLSDLHEYVLLYTKQKQNWTPNLFERPQELNAKYSNPDDDARGAWIATNLSVKTYSKANDYVIKSPAGLDFSPPPSRAWVVSEARYRELLSDNRITFGRDGRSRPYLKTFLSEVQQGIVPTTLWLHSDAGHNIEAKTTIRELFGENAGVFDTPKPTRLLRKIIVMAESDNKNDTILDFFAGSGTTAHAVMELNAEDGGSRQCISVQMPELLNEDSEAYKAGYRTIADITRARIDKVIAKLKAENPIATQDLACAHFTLAPSNFKVWRGDVGNLDALREQLAMFQTAQKDPSTSSGRTDEGAGQAETVSVNPQTAMLAELLLKHGLGALGVHAVAKPRQMAGVTVHRVRIADDKRMWLCFDTYTDALKDEIIKATPRPVQVVMLNSCFVGNKSDEQLSNLHLELAGLDIGLTVI